MGRVLVIDDLQLRQDWFRDVLTQCDQVMDEARSVGEAVLVLKERLDPPERLVGRTIVQDPPAKFDVIFLDFDVDVGFDRRNFGEFVRWATENDFVRERLLADGTVFFIHSTSCDDGVDEMQNLLERLGFCVLRCEFQP